MRILSVMLRLTMLILRSVCLGLRVFLCLWSLFVFRFALICVLMRFAVMSVFMVCKVDVFVMVWVGEMVMMWASAVCTVHAVIDFMVLIVVMIVVIMLVDFMVLIDARSVIMVLVAFMV